MYQEIKPKYAGGPSAGPMIGGIVGGAVPEASQDGPLHQKFKQLSDVISGARYSATLLRERLGPVIGPSTVLSGGLDAEDPLEPSEVEQMLVECIRAVAMLNEELGDLRGQLRI